MRSTSLLLLACLLACGGDEKTGSTATPNPGTTTTATGASTGAGTGSSTGTGTGTTTGTGTGASTGSGTGTGTGTGSTPDYACGPTLRCDVGEACYGYVGGAGGDTWACQPMGTSCTDHATCACTICDQPGQVTAVCSDVTDLGAVCTFYL